MYLYVDTAEEEYHIFVFCIDAMTDDYTTALGLIGSGGPVCFCPWMNDDRHVDDNNKMSRTMLWCVAKVCLQIE